MAAPHYDEHRAALITNKGVVNDSGIAVTRIDLYINASRKKTHFTTSRHRALRDRAKADLAVVKALRAENPL